MQVTQESIHTMFKAPNEVYKRAFRRLRDGHIDVESLSLMKALGNDSGEEICVLTVQVAASLRWVGRWVSVCLSVCMHVVCRCVTVCVCHIIKLTIVLFNGLHF